MLGSTEIGKIERLFGVEIEDDDFTTIAGLVINESGKVPRSGEHLTFRGLDVEVLEADERRIGRLRLKRARKRTGAKVKPADDHQAQEICSSYFLALARAIHLRSVWQPVYLRRHTCRLLVLGNKAQR